MFRPDSLASGQPVVVLGQRGVVVVVVVVVVENELDTLKIESVSGAINGQLYCRLAGAPNLVVPSSS